jgi:hypothetical protein
MVKLQWVLFLIGISVACARELPSNTMPTISNISSMGTREVILDSSKPFVVVSIYGVTMGTPDQTTFENLLSQAKSDGTVVDFTQTSSGIEGGGTYCIELSTDINFRKAFFYDVEKFETNKTVTNFQALSRETCF